MNLNYISTFVPKLLNSRGEGLKILAEFTMTNLK